MAIVEKSFVVPAPQFKVWSIVSELKNWDELTAAQRIFANKKAGVELVDGAGSGAGARCRISIGGDVFHEGTIERWEAPRLFAVHTQSAARHWYCSEAFFSVETAPQDSLTTRVDLRLEFNFTHRYFGNLVTLFFFPHSRLKRCVDDIAARLREMLERA